MFLTHPFLRAWRAWQAAVASDSSSAARRHFGRGKVTVPFRQGDSFGCKVTLSPPKVRVSAVFASGHCQPVNSVNFPARGIAGETLLDPAGRHFGIGAERAVEVDPVAH